MTLVSSRPFHGHTGRSYKLSIGELNGVAHAFATRKRFYVVVSLNTKKDDELEEKFLSSFVLPNGKLSKLKVASARIRRCSRSLGKNRHKQQINRIQTRNREPKATLKAPRPIPQTKKKQATRREKPINGGMLNGKRSISRSPRQPARAWCWSKS